MHCNCREPLLKTEWDHLTTVRQIWLQGTWYWVRNATATWHTVLVQPDCVFLVQICFWQINFVSGYMPLGYRTVIICPNHTKSAWKCKASKEKSSVSAYSWLNFYIWMVLSFTDEEQYLWNSSPRSQPVVTGCLDLISCSWYSPIFANCSVWHMPSPTHWCHCSSAWVQDLPIQNNSSYSVGPTAWTVYEVLCKKRGEGKEWC